MKKRKRTFEELVMENRLELMKNSKQLELIEDRLEKRHLQKAE